MPKKPKKKIASRMSRKVPIVEALFNARWNPATSGLSSPVVTLADVEEAIRAQNVLHPGSLSGLNPANFFKDIVRRRRSANRWWPKSVWDRGYTAVQRTGESACFEFLPLAPGQTEPFPDHVPLALDVPRFKIETLSLPLASRRLGRGDETWLTQVLVRLRIVETHLALVSRRRFVQLDHLQMGIKLRRTEIDALFLAHEDLDGSNAPREVIVSCEAKVKDDILVDQILAQVKAVFHMNVEQDHVLPMAAKVVDKSLIRIVEFNVVNREEASSLMSVTPVSDALYELVPPVPGIGPKLSRRQANEEPQPPP